MRPGWAAALRNYASPVFVRDNAYCITAGMMLVLLAMDDRIMARHVAHHGLRAALSGSAPDLAFLWMAAFWIPACITFHYWRQVHAAPAPAIPGFLDAEFFAAAVMLGGSTLLLSLPLLALHAPFFGTLALVSLGLVMGGSVSAVNVPTGQSQRLRRARGLLFLPLMFLGYIPNAMATIVFAPWPAAGALAAVSAVILLSSLRYLPAQAALQGEQVAQRTDERAPVARPSRLAALLMWRPAFMPAAPLPIYFGLPLGPLGSLFGAAVMLPAFVALNVLFGLLDGHGLAYAVREHGAIALAQAVAVGGLGSTQWLMSRGEWPMLFVAGYYGGRERFARGLFAAHRANAVQVALCTALVAVILGLMLHVVQPGEAIAGFLVFACMVFGTQYAAALPLLFGEAGGKGTIMTANLIAMFAVMFISQASLPHLGAWWPRALAVIFVAFGLVVGHVAPRRLARMDWPIEAEPAPV